MVTNGRTPARPTRLDAMLFGCGASLTVALLIILALVLSAKAQGETWKVKLDVIENGQIIEYRTNAGLPSEDICKVWMTGPAFRIAFLMLAQQVAAEDPDAELASEPVCVNADIPPAPPRPAPPVLKGEPT